LPLCFFYTRVIIPFTRKRWTRRLEQIPFGNTIHLSNVVKYFGLALDKGLIWKKQLDKVLNKATGPFVSVEACSE
jgi:hypothetical protein